MQQASIILTQTGHVKVKLQLFHLSKPLYLSNDHRVTLWELETLNRGGID
jgi:hypothetical protein